LAGATRREKEGREVKTRTERERRMEGKEGREEGIED
jgi:hypothetical protein